MDIHDYFRGARPWNQFYRFLDRLPRHSHFHASVMADEKHVEELLSRGTAPRGPSLVGWTYERELLTIVVDVLNQLHATFIQANSEKGDRPHVDPMPRPQTALDRLENKQAINEHRARVALMRPVASG